MIAKPDSKKFTNKKLIFIFEVGSRLSKTKKVIKAIRKILCMG